MADEGDAAVGPSERGWLRADLGVDLVVVGAFVATWLLWMRWTSSGWFVFDEWALAGRGRTLRDFFEPYNNHLSIPYIAVYRVHMGLFGFDNYTVLRVIGLTALAAGPPLLYVTTRGVVGRGWAAAMALMVLWTRGVSLEPGAMNHWAVVACTVVGAWAVRRSDRRADPWLLGALSLGLITSGGMVAFGAGALVWCLLGRATVRRWAFVVVPLAGWFLWYLQQDRIPLPPEYQLDRGEALQVVVDGHIATIDGLALGVPALGWLLALFMLGVAAYRLHTYGRRAAVPLLAWGAASIGWWLGLVQSRQILASPDVFRYRFVCAIFLLLALVPPEGPRREGTVPRPVAALDRVPGALVPVAVAILAVVLAWGNLDATREEAQLLERLSIRTHVQSLVAMAEPPVMDLDEQLPLGVGMQTPAQLRTLRDWYGPPGLGGAELDRALVDTGAFLVEHLEPRRPARCRQLDGSTLGDDETVIVAAVGDEAVVVSASRFGEQPVEVVRVPAGGVR